MDIISASGCCWYHKGTNFQANHNRRWPNIIYAPVVADTTKVRIFKQITTNQRDYDDEVGCCWYHKGTNFQANHNKIVYIFDHQMVVADTTKVRIFKQITTAVLVLVLLSGCCWYHKGTNFQANHNALIAMTCVNSLLLIPQRYEFSSKSQRGISFTFCFRCCCWYHKGTNFQANHNILTEELSSSEVVADTTKVRIFKQITTTIQN